MRVIHPHLWDRGHGTNIWPDTFELARIIPRAGERRRVYLDKYEAVEDGQQIRCIWTPPQSELNGWNEQPSEIALSYVVTGIAHPRGVATAHPYPDISDYFEQLILRSLAVDIDVQMSNPLFDTLSVTAPVVDFDLSSYGVYLSSTAQSVPLWLEGGHASYANVGSYTYLWTRSCETILEALVRIFEGDMILAYHRYWPPVGDYACILNNVLNKEDRFIFEKVMSIADPLEDQWEPYLI